ncbi:hypothetical protein ES705_45942 [subsurface metagenome]
MILSAREYAKKYAGNCSRDTVIRKIQKGLLPSNHKGRKIGKGKTYDWIIEIQDLSHLKDYDIILKRKSKQ